MIEIKDFSIVKEIGKGGMAVVYEAIQQPLDRPVALKVLPPNLHADSEQFAKRFDRETKILARMSHPGIVRVYAAGSQENYFYLAMEMLNGGTLKDRIADKTITKLDDILSVIKIIAEALLHSHQIDIIHRDVKPENILFRGEGNRDPVLVDFGIARRLDGSENVTVDMSVIGSTAYMSPEQALGKTLTDKSDVFSLGVVFYEMVNGEKPFPDNYGELVLAHHKGLKTVAYSDENKTRCQLLWEKMLAIDVEHRITMQEVIEATDNLQQALKLGSVVQADQPTLIVPLAAAEKQDGKSQQSDVVGNEAEEDSDEPGISRTLLLSLLVVSVTAIAYFVYSEFNNRNISAGGDVKTAFCCSTDQIDSLIQRKHPQSMVWALDESSNISLVNGVRYGQVWRFYAPGYVSEAHEISSLDDTVEVELTARERFSPEEFYRYQSLLSNFSREAASRYVNEYPASVFAPVIQIIMEPSSLEDFERQQLEDDPVAMFQLSEIYGLALEGFSPKPDIAKRYALLSSQQNYAIGLLQSAVLDIEEGVGLSESSPSVQNLQSLANSGFWLAELIYAQLMLGILSDNANFGISNENASVILKMLFSASESGDFLSDRILVSLFSNSQLTNSLLGVTSDERSSLLERHKQEAQLKSEKLAI